MGIAAFFASYIEIMKQTQDRRGQTVTGSERTGLEKAEF